MNISLNGVVGGRERRTETPHFQIIFRRPSRTVVAGQGVSLRMRTSKLENQALFTIQGGRVVRKKGPFSSQTGMLLFLFVGQSVCSLNHRWRICFSTLEKTLGVFP